MTIPIINANGDDTLNARLQGMTLPRVIGGSTGLFSFAFYAALTGDLTRSPIDALSVVRLLQSIELMVFQQVLKAKAERTAQ